MGAKYLPRSKWPLSKQLKGNGMAGQADANRYFKELVESFGCLGAIGDKCGKDTMAQLWWLHDAILNGGGMELYPDESARAFLIAAGLPSGAEWSSPDIWPFPLHAATDFEDEKLCGFMLERGFDPNSQNGDGATPLHYAAANGSAGLCKLLMEHGADPGIVDGEGHSAIDITASPEVRNLLLARVASNESRVIAASAVPPSGENRSRRI